MRTLLALGVLFGFDFPAFAADPPAKVDRYGDPLPAGALMRLGTLRNRAPITGFGIKKDGTVVTAGPAAEVRLWSPVEDRSDTPLPLPLKGPTTSNNYPQVSPDGKYVAACSTEKVFVWETPADAKAKPKELAAFELARPRLFRFSPDGTKLAVATESGTAHICDPKTGGITHLDGTVRYFEGIHFSGDGKRLGASADSEFMLWDTATGKQLAKYRTNGRMSSSFALNHTGDTLAARMDYAGPRSEFRFTDPLTGKKRDGLTGPADTSWVSYAPDGKTLIVGDPYSIRWWDPVAGKLIRRFDGIGSESYALQYSPARFTPDGKTLVFQTGHALLRWDATTGKPLFPEQDTGHCGYVNGIGISPDGKRIATRGMDNRVCVWDAATGKQLCHAPAYWTNSPSIDFSPDGKFLCVGGPKWGEVTTVDAATGKALRTFVTDPKEPKQANVYCTRLSKDGKTVYALTGPYTANDPSFVTAWDAATGERVKATRLTSGAMMGGELSPDGQYAATGDIGRGGVVSVAASEKNLLEGAGLRGSSFLPGDFSVDGKWLTQINMEQAEGGWKYSAVVISTLTWRGVAVIPLTGNGKAALAPDGRTLAVAVGESLEFYDCATTKSLGSYRVPANEWTRILTGVTHALRFTPDGKKLITGHKDTTALVWPVPPLAK